MNIQKILAFHYKQKQILFDLQKWITAPWKQRDILDNNLDLLKIEKTKETRYAIYSRLVNLNEEPLKNYLKAKWESDRIEDTLYSSHAIISDFHNKKHRELISYCDNSNLLSPFYLAILEWSLDVWKA